MSSIGKYLQISIIKKQIMAVTGLFLVFFVISHLLGNLTLLVPNNAGNYGQAFINYAEKLHSLPLLQIVELVLFGAFLVHIITGLTLVWQNYKARPVRYKVTADNGGRTLGSKTMPYTGALLIIFLVLHLGSLTFAGLSPGQPVLDVLVQAFKTPLYTTTYTVMVILLGIHVSHGFQSAFQTFGWNHEKYTPSIRIIGKSLAVVLAVGFATIPMFVFLNY